MASIQRKRRFISLLIALILTVLSYYTLEHPQQAAKIASTVPTGSYRVTDFTDGDTIAVDMNGRIEKIRMIGVDTPETHDPRKSVECFGKAASEYTKQLLGDKPVRLEADQFSSNRDRYNRLLRYVYTQDNKLVQAEIIKNGYGFAYVSFPFSKLEEFRGYEKDAREQKKGLWSGCAPYTDKNGHIHSSTEN